MEIDDKVLSEKLKEKQKSCSMNQLQELRDEMAQNQIIKHKTLPVQNQEKKEEKNKEKTHKLTK